jgi:hypothetical protein
LKRSVIDCADAGDASMPQQMPAAASIAIPRRRPGCATANLKCLLSIPTPGILRRRP